MIVPAARRPVVASGGAPPACLGRARRPVAARGPRARFGWLAALAGAWLLVVLAVCQVAETGSGRQLRAAPEADGGLASLPIAAQGPVSAVLGRDWASYRIAGFKARNPAQRLALAFSPRGVTIAAGRQWVRLSLSGFGRAGAVRRVAALPPVAVANRVVYEHPGALEWYENGPLGLEQGFTVARAPHGGRGPLVLSVSLAGVLRPRVDRGTVLLSGHGGQLRYGGLVVVDARGRVLRSWLSVRAGGVWVQADDRGAAYPLRVDPFIQKGPKVTGSGETAQGEFGASMALAADGKTAVIGGPGDDGGAGAAWVFTRGSGGAWTQQGSKLVGSGAVGDASQGASVALSSDGDTAIIGGPGDNRGTGAAWAFTRSGSTWIQQGPKLTADDASGAALEGSSVALSADGSTALSGGYGDDGFRGAGWVFTRSGASWRQQGPKLVGAGAIGGFDDQGWSAALSSDGGTALIGGPGDNSGAGAAWVFTRSSGSTWSQQAKLVVGGRAGAAAGSSVSLSGDGSTALIGGPNDNNQVGAAWVFTRGSGSTWSQQATLNGADASGASYEGVSVALSSDGNMALLGGPGDNHGTGAMWQFDRDASGQWVQQGPKLVGSGATGAAYQGISVALSSDGNTALVGGPYDNGKGAFWGYVLGLPQTIVFTSSPPEPTNVTDTYTPMATGGGSGNVVVFSIDPSSGTGVCSLDSSHTRVSFTGVGTCVIDANQAGNGDYDPAPQQQQIITVLPLLKLIGSNADLASQGWSVAFSSDGSTALVGGPGDNDDKGAAWVFTRSGSTWIQQGPKLVGSGAVGAAEQGWSVALSSDGNTALVSGPGDTRAAGAVWVFTRSNGVWTQQGPKLVGTGATGAAFQGAGVALSADGTTALIGGYADANLAGAAWVFARSNGVWRQQGSKLVGTGATGASYQGWRVALSSDGNTALVGGPHDNGDTGAAWAFTRSSGVWAQQGSKLVGAGASGAAQQGWGVALSGDGNTALIGGRADNGYQGAAWAFTRPGGTWTQQGPKLVGAGASGAAALGTSVALSSDGNTALVGGAGDSSGRGAAWLFARSDAGWAQDGSKLVGKHAIGASSQGVSVALSSDGNTALVGGPGDNGNAGAAWVFTSVLTSPAIDNHFRVSAVKARPGGKLTLTITVPRRGTMDVLAITCPRLRPTKIHSGLFRPGASCFVFARHRFALGRYGRHTLTVRPSKRAAQQIRHQSRPIRIELWASYRPAGGTSRSIAIANLDVIR